MILSINRGYSGRFPEHCLSWGVDGGRINVLCSVDGGRSTNGNGGQVSQRNDRIK